MVRSTIEDKRRAAAGGLKNIENARLRGPNRLLIEDVLLNNGLHDEWLKLVAQIYEPYRERTMPDEVIE